MTEFRYFLNRQGVRGAKGDKGEKGFSPIITEKENTKESYVLHIQNETDDTSFDTPNLKEGLVPEDLGGTYVKLNRDTGRQYYGNIDEGTNTTKGVVRFATDVEASNGEEVTAAVTPDQVAASYTTKATTNKLSADLTALTTQEQNDVIALGKRITINETNISSMRADIKSLASDVTDNEADISTMKTSLSMKQTKLTAGENITLTDLSDGTVKIDSTGGGGATIDDSTTTTTSVWSSSKTNTEITTVANEVVQVQGDVASLDGDVSTLKTGVSGLKTDVSGLKTSKQNTLVSGTNIKTINGETILGEGDIAVGGSSNVIDDTTASTTTTYSSSKIDELIGNISTALDSINGEVI